MRLLFDRLALVAAALLTVGVSSAAENDVLYWMVDETATVTRTDGRTATISDYLAIHPPERTLAHLRATKTQPSAIRTQH